MKLLLCSDTGSLLNRWQQILEGHFSLSKVGNISALQQKIRQGDHDLILVHRSLVDLDFLDELEESPYILLTDKPDDNEAVTVLRKGSLAYANAYISGPRLLEAVQAALAGRVWIGRNLMQKIIRGTRLKSENRERVKSKIEGLTERERQVAVSVGSGKSNQQVATELDISERTVKAHLSAIFKKTETSSRLQLALLMKGQFTS